MRFSLRCVAILGLIGTLVGISGASAYNARPKLIVVVVIDQFRADYLERFHDQFVEGGFRTFTDRGAWFTNCNYQYANTKTAPGHATLFTGAYSVGHGIAGNEWWDPKDRKMVTSVQDDSTQLIGVPGKKVGASPHNLLSDTIGDELRLATQGKARVFGVSLKDRAAVLPAGFSGNGAYWIDHKTGAWVSSTYYRPELPDWVKQFNDSNRAAKYWDREWKDSDGTVLRTTARMGKDGPRTDFYNVVGPTPFATDYELEFARELVLYEKLGAGESTDFLVVSLSANDILGHDTGPYTPEMNAIALAFDRQLADFFNFLGHQVGLANMWMALSADHGVAPLPAQAKGLRLPAGNLDEDRLLEQINVAVGNRLGIPGKTQFVQKLDYPLAFLDQKAFPPRLKEEDAERAVGEAMKLAGFRDFYTRSQLALGSVPPTSLGRKYANSYTSHSGWYVMGVPEPFKIAVQTGTDHGTPYPYDTHVPLAFYGIPFQPGVYRRDTEPIDLVATFSSLLGINPPVGSSGRVLTEALVPQRQSSVPNPDAPPKSNAAPHTPPSLPSGPGPGGSGR